MDSNYTPTLGGNAPPPISFPQSSPWKLLWMYKILHQLEWIKHLRATFCPSTIGMKLQGCEPSTQMPQVRIVAVAPGVTVVPQRLRGELEGLGPRLMANGILGFVRSKGCLFESKGNPETQCLRPPRNQVEPCGIQGPVPKRKAEQRCDVATEATHAGSPTGVMGGLVMCTSTICQVSQANTPSKPSPTKGVGREWCRLARAKFPLSCNPVNSGCFLDQASFSGPNSPPNILCSWPYTRNLRPDWPKLFIDFGIVFAANTCITLGHLQINSMQLYAMITTPKHRCS